MKDSPTINFADVSLMVTHYNRSKSLERLLFELRKSGCIFHEIIISDDGSMSSHLEYLRMLQSTYEFKLITSPVNKGLGNNINKGQDAVVTDYTLYIQEDFVPLGNFASHLANGLNLLKENSEFDIVRFYAYNKYPYLQQWKHGFSEMLFKWWYPGLDKFAYYSDHPHLRRKNFIHKFGRYKEGVSGDKTEFSMMMSFLKKKGKAFFFDDHKSMLMQVNSEVEPSTMSRNRWRNSNNIFIAHLRSFYRYINCYSALYFRN